MSTTLNILAQQTAEPNVANAVLFYIFAVIFLVLLVLGLTIFRA